VGRSYHRCVLECKVMGRGPHTPTAQCHGPSFRRRP
jgi:hypothetical protein